MTPTNACLGRLDPAHISRMDRDGRLFDGAKPTKESLLNMAMYAERPQSGTIVHLHSTHSVAVSCLPEVDPGDCVPPLTAYYVMRVGKLPLGPRHESGRAVRGLAGQHSAVLLANHGPVVAGNSMEAAVYATEELEETAKLFLLTRGQNPHALTPEQVAELEARVPKD